MTLTRFLDAGATVTSQPTTIRFQHAGDRRRAFCYRGRAREAAARNLPASCVEAAEEEAIPQMTMTLES